MAYALHKSGVLHVNKLHKLAFRLIFENKSDRAIKEAVDSFLNQEKHKLLRKSLMPVLEEAKRECALIWIQSSSPYFLVQPIAEMVGGVSCVLASEYALSSDCTYSHVKEVVNGESKRKFLDQFLEKNLVSRNEVTAYSDSMLDLPLLEGVGRPVVVDPEKKLRKLAKMRCWKIWQEE